MDLDTFDAGVKFISDFGKDDLMPHFIYCGGFYFVREEELKERILTKMIKYGVQSSILTMLTMERQNLVTQETVKKAAEGQLKNDPDWEDYEGSINDDLEKFLINLQNQKEMKYEFVKSFFTPKLTNEEMKLVQEENAEHLKTYFDYENPDYGNSDYGNPDVDVEEMKKSDSKSKYVHGKCWRRTFLFTLGTSQFEDEMEMEYGTETEDETEDETENKDEVSVRHSGLPDAKKAKMQE